MKKKIWFISGHLKAGGAERVFWLLSQHFDKSKFDVSLVLLDSTNAFFSTDLKDVTLIDLKTLRASKSAFKLWRLISQEKPYAIFTNDSYMNILIAGISLFASIPMLIGREVNVPDLKAKISGGKDLFWDKFVSFAYKRINVGICQSEEIRRSLIQKYGISAKKLKVIPNPVISTTITQSDDSKDSKKLLAIARLTPQKGLFRLLEIVKGLPDNYTLSIAGDGPLKYNLIQKIQELNLENRVKLLGIVKDIPQLISLHSLLVLSSYTEGFPNVVLEALSVGVPVVSFKVSGISALIRNDFNGYIADQDNLEDFKNKIIKAGGRSWNTEEIKQDVNSKFSVKKIVRMYEDLIQKPSSKTEPKLRVAEMWQD